MTVWFHLCLLSILKTKLSKPAFFHSCFTGGMKKPWLFSVYQGFYYPVMWGLFHKHINHEIMIPINQPGFPMERKGTPFFLANRPGFNRWLQPSRQSPPTTNDEGEALRPLEVFQKIQVERFGAKGWCIFLLDEGLFGTPESSKSRPGSFLNLTSNKNVHPVTLTAGTQKWRFGSDDFPSEIGWILGSILIFGGGLAFTCHPVCSLKPCHPSSLTKWCYGTWLMFIHYLIVVQYNIHANNWHDIFGLWLGIFWAILAICWEVDGLLLGCFEDGKQWLSCEWFRFKWIQKKETETVPGVAAIFLSSNWCHMKACDWRLWRPCLGFWRLTSY